MKLNNNGFVLLETLIVTIFILIVFTVLYTTAVPLLGRYKELSYYNNIDITYDLYYIRKMIYNDSNYSTIYNYSYKKLSCNDLTSNTEYCYNLFDKLNINIDDELIFLNTSTGLNTLKDDVSISSEVKDYLDRINLEGNILILQRDGYLSYLNVNKNI